MAKAIATRSKLLADLRATEKVVRLGEKAVAELQTVNGNLRRKIEARDRTIKAQEEIIEKGQSREFGQEREIAELRGWQARVREVERTSPDPDRCCHEWEGLGREAICRKCGSVNPLDRY